MRGLQIIKPITAAITATGTGVENLQTPSPREVWASPGTGAQQIDLDLGSAQDVDSFYLGSTNAAATSAWSIQSIAGIGGAATATHVDNQLIRLGGNIRNRYPAFARLPAPVNGRYFRIRVEATTVVLQIGALVVGLALEWPYAYGSGRTPIDTSRVVALPDGGFGIDRGVVKTMFQWRFLDLDEATLAKLWQIAEDRGESAPLVVVEGPASPPLATSVHYGLFRRFEQFEREDPAATKWSMSIEEWR